jgi:hypothetical protein
MVQNVKKAKSDRSSGTERSSGDYGTIILRVLDKKIFFTCSKIKLFTIL